VALSVTHVYLITGTLLELQTSACTPVGSEAKMRWRRNVTWEDLPCHARSMSTAERGGGESGPSVYCESQPVWGGLGQDAVILAWRDVLEPHEEAREKANIRRMFNPE
jgi:hypothetical protein